MGVCVHGLCLETVHELAKSTDSNLGAGHVRHLAKPMNNQTGLLETMFLLCRLRLKSRPLRPSQIWTKSGGVGNMEDHFRRTHRSRGRLWNDRRCGSTDASSHSEFQVNLTLSPLHKGSWPLKLSHKPKQPQDLKKAPVTPKGLLGYAACHSYTLFQSKYLHLSATVVCLRAHTADPICAPCQKEKQA